MGHCLTPPLREQMEKERDFCANAVLEPGAMGIIVFGVLAEASCQRRRVLPQG